MPCRRLICSGANGFSSKSRFMFFSFLIEMSVLLWPRYTYRLQLLERIARAALSAKGSCSSLGPVEQFNDVITNQHVLSAGNELPVSSAGVVCQAVLSIGAVGDQNHHPAAFLDQNRMADQPGNSGDMFFHVSNDLLQQIIADNFTNEHFCGS